MYEHVFLRQKVYLDTCVLNKTTVMTRVKILLFSDKKWDLNSNNKF